MAMSWSENREKGSIGPSLDSLKEKVRQINAVLTKLAKDEDLQDDLKMPDVQRALQHWTGQNRLPPEQAEHLRDHRRAIYVLQRLQMLQMVCNDAGVKVPLDLMLKGGSELPPSTIKTLFPKLWEVEYASQSKSTEASEAFEGSVPMKKTSKPSQVKEEYNGDSNNISKVNVDQKNTNSKTSTSTAAKENDSVGIEATSSSTQQDHSAWIVVVSLIVSIIATLIAVRFMQE